jgi:ABC-type protease/lipase transport system fused ATPase/permease subunit
MAEPVKDYSLVPSPEGGADDKANTFYFDVSFAAIEKQKTKVIVDKVSDIVQSGQTLAIMGPSGIFI